MNVVSHYYTIRRNSRDEERYLVFSIISIAVFNEIILFVREESVGNFFQFKRLRARDDSVSDEDSLVFRVCSLFLVSVT